MAIKMESQELEQVLKILKSIQATQVKAEAARKADHEEMMAMMKAWRETLDAWSTDTKDDTERETRKGQTEKNRRSKRPLCKTGIKNPTMNNIKGRNPGKRAPLGSGGSRKKDIRDIFREKIMEHGVGISSGLQRRKKWTLWMGRPPPKRKKQH
jgi:DNA-binding protein H-NS